MIARPGRFASACVIAGVTAIAFAHWLVARFGSNVIVVGACAAVLAVFLILAIPPVDDVLTSRSREVSRPHPARGAGSLPRAGGPGITHAHRTTRRVRPRVTTFLPEADARPGFPSRWL